MGEVFGLSLFRGDFFNKENQRSAFTIADLFRELENDLTGDWLGINLIEDKELVLTIKSEDSSFFLEKGSEQLKFKYDALTDQTKIQAVFMTSRLYYLLIILTYLGKELTLICEGETPFCTPQNMERWNGKGNYCYVNVLEISHISVYITQLVNQFKNWKEYWEIKMFIENYAIITFNNHTQSDGFYNLEQEYFSAESEDNFYYVITLDVCIQKLDEVAVSLNREGFTHLLTAFQPMHKSFYKFEVVLNGCHNLTEMVSEFLSSDFNSNKRMECIDVAVEKDSSITINSYFKIVNEDEKIFITDEDLEKGSIYFDKIYNEKLFKYLASLIAKNFCPCTIGGYHYQEIFYQKEEDKLALEQLYRDDSIELTFVKIT